MPALLFGSISTLADTSELQREAFNQAFAAAGLDWEWSQDEYRSMLDGNGGAARIAAYAADRGDDVDAEAVHTAKSKIFQESLATADLSPRPHVVDALTEARGNGWRTALVTTTSGANIAALLDALSPDVTAELFDVVVDVDDVADPKPAPDAYGYALTELGLEPDDCTAIEDNPGGVAAAAAAGIRCLAFPNENTAGLDFPGADRVVEDVTFEDVAAS